jgi:hypothetical protein
MDGRLRALAADGGSSVSRDAIVHGSF